MVEFWKSQQNFEQYRQFLYEMFAESVANGKILSSIVAGNRIGWA